MRKRLGGDRMPVMGKDVYTTEEAAARLGVTSARVRQMILDGLLQTERFGRAHVITPAAIEVARQRRTKPGPVSKLEKLSDEKKRGKIAVGGYDKQENGEK